MRGRKGDGVYIESGIAWHDLTRLFSYFKSDGTGEEEEEEEEKGFSADQRLLCLMKEEGFVVVVVVVVVVGMDSDADVCWRRFSLYSLSMHPGTAAKIWHAERRRPTMHTRSCFFSFSLLCPRTNWWRRRRWWRGRLQCGVRPPCVDDHFGSDYANNSSCRTEPNRTQRWTEKCKCSAVQYSTVCFCQ